MYFMRNYNLLDEFHNMFNDAFSSKMLKTDIIEKENEYELNIEMPGVLKDNIELDFKESYLTISVKEEKKNEDLKYIRKERVSGSYSRSYYLDMADGENISAKLTDGILNIIIKKLKKLDTKRIISVE